MTKPPLWVNKDGEWVYTYRSTTFTISYNLHTHCSVWYLHMVTQCSVQPINYHSRTHCLGNYMEFKTCSYNSSSKHQNGWMRSSWVINWQRGNLGESETVSVFERAGYGCSRGIKGGNCSQPFSEAVVLVSLNNCMKLSHGELDLVILANMQAFMSIEVSGKKRKRSPPCSFFFFFFF